MSNLRMLITVMVTLCVLYLCVNSLFKDSLSPEMESCLNRIHSYPTYDSPVVASAKSIWDYCQAEVENGDTVR